MEEDIKFIKYYINEYIAVDDIGIEDDFKFQEAIEHLINRNKKLEENKLNKESWRKLANTYKKDLDNSISKDVLRKDLQYMKNAQAHGLQQLFIKKGITRYLEELIGEEK